MNATVTSKGQVTIPVKIRRKLGIEPGTVLDFDEEAPYLKARQAIPPGTWESFRDHATSFELDHPWASMTSMEILDDMRGPVELPPETSNEDGD